MENTPTLIEFLTFLSAGGGLAFLLERVRKFEKLSSQAKIYITVGLMVGLPVLAQLVLGVVPKDILVELTPYFRSLYTGLKIGLSIYLGSQVAHKFDKAE